MTPSSAFLFGRIRNHWMAIKKKTKTAAAVIGSIVGVWLALHYGLSEERLLFTCTACLKDDPKRCITYAGDDEGAASNEADAQEATVMAFCIRDYHSGGDPNCDRF